jgi:hypothetical protein
LESETFRIIVDCGPDADERAVNKATVELLGMLKAKRVGTIERVSADESSEGGKSADLFALGAVAVALAPQMADVVVAIVNSWFERRTGRSAKIVIGGDTLELTGISPAQQQSIIDLFSDNASAAPGEAADDEA